MDPFSALGLASNVLQFVDVGVRLVSKGREIHNSVDGNLSVNREIELTTKDLIQICDGLTSPESHVDLRDSSEAERALIPLCNACKQLGEELLHILQSLSLGNKHRKWMTVRQALRSACKKSKIRSYEQRLGAFRSQIVAHLMSMLQVKRSVDHNIAEYFQTEELVGGQSKIAGALDELAASHIRLEVVTANEVGNLRKEILVLLSSIRHCKDDQIFEPGKFDLPRNLHSQLLALPMEARALTKDIDFLGSLCFPTIFERQAHIAEAHPRTYEWLFDITIKTTRRSKFDGAQPQICVLDWLRKHHGIYWISGKAGSGKSTLVKFLFYHEKTLAALKEWAGEKQILTAHFFFWNAGTKMQRSQQGLLQTLLYHVLRQCPSLIREICPMWPHNSDLQKIVWTR